MSARSNPRLTPRSNPNPENVGGVEQSTPEPLDDPFHSIVLFAYMAVAAETGQ
jgi:hypothetical protein